MTTLKIHDEKEKLKLKKSTLRSLEQYASEFLQFSFRSAKKHQKSMQTHVAAQISKQSLIEHKSLIS